MTDDIFPFTVYDASYLWIPVREEDFIWKDVSCTVYSKTKVVFYVFGSIPGSFKEEEIHSFERTFEYAKLKPFIDRRIQKMAYEIRQQELAAIEHERLKCIENQLRKQLWKKRAV